MIVRRFICSILGVFFLVAGVRSAAPQAGPPCGPDLPIKCDSGKGAAILAGIVGAGALAVYLAYRMDHPRGQTSIAGCTTLADGVMTLTGEGTQTSFLLTPAPRKVKAGERVILKGKKSQDAAGKNVLRVTKVVKDEGPCNPPDAARNDAK